MSGGRIAGPSPGAMARCVATHGEWRAPPAGFDETYRARVAAGLAEFGMREGAPGVHPDTFAGPGTAGLRGRRGFPLAEVRRAALPGPAPALRRHVVDFGEARA